MDIDSIAIIVALILSIVLHEMSHGYMADWLGDPTARLAGRLSGNPLVHIDPLGSVIIPGLLFFSGAGILFGWAKPVPYNPYNLTDQKYGEAKVALAGPGMNILIAVIFGGLIQLATTLGLSNSFISLSYTIVYINVLLALFNLLPIPPLDGSKILISILPYSLAMKYRDLTNVMERYGFVATFIFIFIFISILWKPFSIIVKTLVGILTGI